MKKTRTENVLALAFVVLFLLSIIMVMNQRIKTTGYATETSTISNVTVSTYFAIEMSANLSNGIEFGTVSVLPATSINATDNNNSENTTSGGSIYNQSTSLWVNVSSDSNSALDFCIKANDSLKTGGGASIGIGNETFANHTLKNVTVPDVALETALSTSYAKSGSNIGIGSRNIYRFWLDIPAATTAGDYINAVYFKGVTTGSGC